MAGVITAFGAAGVFGIGQPMALSVGIGCQPKAVGMTTRRQLEAAMPPPLRSWLQLLLIRLPPIPDADDADPLGAWGVKAQVDNRDARNAD